MRGAAFVPRLLPQLGLLPDLVANLAPHPGAELRQQVSQMLLNAALHRGLATALDAAEAPKVRPGLLHQPSSSNKIAAGSLQRESKQGVKLCVRGYDASPLLAPICRP